jgi:hypothetical protein
VGLATDRQTAISVLGQEPGLIANPNLTHFDSGPEVTGQGADKLPEVHPAFRYKIHYQPLPRQKPLYPHQLHWKAELLHMPLTDPKILFFLLGDSGKLGPIGFCHHSQDGSPWQRATGTQVAQNFRGCLSESHSRLPTSLRLNHYLCPPGKHPGAMPMEKPKMSHRPEPHDIGLGFPHSFLFISGLVFLLTHSHSFQKGNQRSAK